MDAKRGREYWSKLVAELDSSGETTAAFAARRRVHPGTLQVWRWKLRQSAAAAKEPEVAVRFVEVQQPTGTMPGLEAVLPGGVVLRLPSEMLTSEVAGWVAALAARLGC